jgi:MscS family membrane protein
LAELIIASPKIHPKGIDAQLIRLGFRVLGIVAAVVVVLEGGRYLGIPLTTLLAGAGVGGLAVALAAQDSLKNLFGSMMIILDKPFSVGDRIIVKGYDGIVEEIGLRSTKIRLLTGHQAAVPNDELARADIENVGRRPYIRRTAVLEMPSNTPVAKVKRALEIVSAVLENHEGMADDFPPRVFLRDLKESSIGIFIIYWYHPPNYWDFLAFSQKINLQIMEELEAEQIPFASPALTIEMSEEHKQLG